MRSISALAIASVLVPILACQVDYRVRTPEVQAQVQVDTPPPPTVTAQVDVNAQPDPNAQAQVDPNAQPDPNAQTTDTDPSAVSDFRDVLAPYGQWADDPQYGTIWQPNPNVVGADFTPYATAGHWVYDNDYTWVSDYDWGWAPFHYGRWVSLPGRGWSWIPGKEYAGAWVTWRNGDDGYGFVGWAPTAPTYYWRGGAAVVLTTPWFQPRYQYVETTNLFVPGIRERIIREPARITMIEGRTRVYAPSGYAVVGGNTRMSVRGPAPTHLGLNVSTLPRPPANNPGLQRAQQFSHQRAGQPIGNNMGSHTVTPGHPPIEQHTGGGTAQQHGMEQGHPADTHTTQMHPTDTHVQEHPTTQGGTQTQMHPTDTHVQEHPTEQHQVVQQQTQQHPQQQVAQPTPTNRKPLPPPTSVTHAHH